MRKIKFGANAIVSSLIVLAIVIGVNFIASKRHIKKDFTRDQLYSISEQTKKFIKELNEDITFVAFTKSANRQKMKDVLDNYSEISTKIHVEFVDPDLNPAKTKQMNITKPETVVIVKGSKQSKVETLTEEALTNALIKLFKEIEQTIYFTQGHGEKDLEKQDANSISFAKKALEGQSYKISPLDILKDAKIPSDAAAIAIVGPQKAFFDKEIEVLKAYLLSGGKLLVALDPDVQQQGLHTELKKLLAEWGVEVGNNIIIDPVSKLFGADAAVPIIQTYSKTHALTKDMKEPSLLPLAGSVEPGKVQGLLIDSVASTGPTSWAESDFKQIASGAVKYDDKTQDKKGPVSIAVAVEGKRDEKAKDKTRIVVIGNSQFASNQFGRHMANQDFFMNMISWIAKDENLISIRPKDGREENIKLSRDSGLLIGFVSVLLIPALLIVFGIWFWNRRRKL